MVTSNLAVKTEKSTNNLEVAHVDDSLNFEKQIKGISNLSALEVIKLLSDIDNHIDANFKNPNQYTALKKFTDNISRRLSDKNGLENVKSIIGDKSEDLIALLEPKDAFRT